MGLMVFTLIYMPCIAAVSVIRKETGSWKWTGFSILYSTALAWGAAFLVRHAGLAMGY
jgi:ferrous iron transport protein B